MLTKATVIGTGAMGCVAAQILAANHAHVALLGRDADLVQELAVLRENRRHLPGVRLLDRVRPGSQPAAALAHTELIVSAVPCQFLRETWTRLRPNTDGSVPVVSVTKGLEEKTQLRPSEILRECIPNRVAVLSGPCIAPEVGRCLPTTVVVASEFEEVGQFIQSEMSTSWFRIYTNADLVGVELAGAVKNVIALAAGILDGLNAGDNAKSALLTRALVEISRLGVAMGAHASTFVGLAGVGDLVTTCTSPVGRNRSAGERIGRGATMAEVVEGTSSVIEGIPTSRAVLALARRYGVEMPITEAVYSVLFENKPPLTAITELMNRPPRAESPT